MSDLLPASATAAERALSEAVARVGAVPVIVRQVWNADICPVAILPWLAWAMSVDEWDPDWTEAQKRAAIKSSMPIHEKKGTVGAVKRAVRAIFGDGAVQEWPEFGGEPHTFKIVTRERVPDDNAFRRLVNLVTAAKPLRSHLISVVLLREPELGFTVGHPLHRARSTDVRNRTLPDVDPTTLFLGFARHEANTITVMATAT